MATMAPDQRRTAGSTVPDSLIGGSTRERWSDHLVPYRMTSTTPATPSVAVRTIRQLTRNLPTSARSRRNMATFWPFL